MDTIAFYDTALGLVRPQNVASSRLDFGGQRTKASNERPQQLWWTVTRTDGTRRAE